MQVENREEAQNSHVLVVDDNPEIREVIRLLLSGEGYDVA